MPLSVQVVLVLVAVALAVIFVWNQFKLWDLLRSVNKTLSRLGLLLDVLGDKADDHRAHVASDLAKAQTEVDKVADDLAVSRGAADAEQGSDPGAAADAGARTPEVA